MIQGLFKDDPGYSTPTQRSVVFGSDMWKCTVQLVSEEQNLLQFSAGFIAHVAGHANRNQDLQEFDPLSFIVVEAKHDKPGVLGEIMQPPTS